MDSLINQLNVQQILLILMLIIFPGLVAMRVYRLIAPAKYLDWQNAFYESSFWGTVNFSVSLLPISIVFYFVTHWEIRLFAVLVLVLFLAILLPFVWVEMRKLRYFRQYFMHPMPTAWDAFFSQSKCCFVLVHLKNGKLIGGYYGENSFAASYPEQKSIYLEKIIRVDENGVFGLPITDSCGIILESDVLEYIEIFDIPTIKEDLCQKK